MSRACSSAADADFTKFGDSTECSPPLKKPKTEAAEIPIFRTINREDPEYWRQREMFVDQYEKSEGYDLDWDKFDYKFAPIKFEWRPKFDVELNNDDLMKLLIKTAIDEENEEYGTQLEFVEYVKANVTGVKGFLFHITFSAKEPNEEPQLYQTQVHKCGHEIRVLQFRPRPTLENDD